MSSPQHGPAVVGAEETVRRAPHVHHILRMRAMPPRMPNTDCTRRWPDHLAFGEMCEVAQVTDVVALELEALPFADNAVTANSISLNVLRKTKSGLFSRCCRSHAA